MAQAQLDCVVPLFYGAMPNMGLYFRPDGPFANPADLLPDGRIEEARETQLEAAARLRDDMLYVSRAMDEAGADGIDFDTTASAGDAEFLATLQAVEELATHTDLAIEVGMATELVLGFHGELDYKGTPARRPLAASAVGSGRGGRRPHLRAGDNHQDEQVDSLERRSRLHLRQGMLAHRHDPRPCQCRHGRRRRADS